MLVTVLATALATVLLVSAGQARPPLREQPLDVHAADGPAWFAVKLRDGVNPRLERGQLAASHAAALQAVATEYGLHFSPGFSRDADTLRAVRRRAAARTGRAQPDLESVLAVWVEHAALAPEIVAKLQGVPEVEFVVLRRSAPPPGDLAPPTPNLTGEQLYLQPDPGLNFVGAWDLDAFGQGVALGEIEYGWALEHEDLVDAAVATEAGQTINPQVYKLGYAPEHGSAALGLLLAPHNGYGIDGVAFELTAYVFPEWTLDGTRRPEAMLSAMEQLAPGDILLLEMQLDQVKAGAFGPAELNAEIWMLTRLAVDLGLVVVAPAGNGGVDLDSPPYQFYRDWGDSGAILVGAGDPTTHAPMGFSSFGERVNVQGWGADVFTLGYGDFASYGDDPLQSYTANFEGTSAAAPLVAGVAAAVQSIVAGRPGVLDSTAMRDLLAATGVPQGPGNHIGPLPDAGAACATALAPDQSAPTVEILTPDADLVVQVAPGQAYEIEIEVAATDNQSVEAVDLVVNGKTLATDKAAPFVFSGAEFPDGSWELIAVARDGWGNEGSSEPRQLQVVAQSAGPTSGAMSTTGGGTSPQFPTSSGTDSDGQSDPGEHSKSKGCNCTHAPQSPMLWVLLSIFFWPGRGLARSKR